MQASPTSKVSCLLLLWCAALTVAFLGMACFVLTGQHRDRNREVDNDANPTKVKASGQMGQQYNSTSTAAAPTVTSKILIRSVGDRHRQTPLIHLTRTKEGWKNSQSTRRISLKSNAIVIEEDGYYYVYSQATFLVKKKDVQLGMTLFKNSPSYPKNRTVCETMDSPHWKERTVPRTLSQGTVVKLEEDDELQLAIQPEESLDLDSMFFGAFKISE
ncbi:tumor necrosis factor ligand superfamily member 10-like isoform X1 [Acipenser oxyrinchus oxyrinchus]|uniref:Tumor necrosis factor ligand superfamily member 10-like isoform X1 n=1 Tax=Acipenser oxyrinchus oxyrinchus TaxID=40147 RepID=A0AAD8CPI5_ACIOX|nr:tumor necrosis factor ligand superfamily member 10-like isoform X1 [Acipenser oxyrinchus oxyrinchus]KAK1155273.1 tumor necrosis factor ligand superfamily member 10-like isoform X1 [Acipenser oxyrinchus oxyrinchus]